MSIFENRLFIRIIVLTLIAAPMILWLVLYLFAGDYPRDLRKILRWIRVLRWIGWGCGSIVFVIALLWNVSVFFAVGLVTFSSGLALPEGWLKKFDQSA